MGASPELFREVDGSRIAAVSVSSRSLAIITRLNHCLSTGCGRSLWLSMNNLVQNNDVTAICCPRNNAEFVRLNIRIEESNLFRDF
ncbi:hypothetical protein [Bradyrhizobium lablabi]|uniref:hypothetical protein n=1 Tax=Bradyrhizobium lablabi TaxID=722472 RepID=UPI000AE5B4A1|nr:hypothetical protein [Bradyrhizobium lablabi]